MTIDLRLGDCLEVMPTLPDHSIDAIIADLPYGTTACSWDVVIPFAPLWAEYKRLIKRNGAIVLTASQPFTSLLVTSNLEWFKYSWEWDKKLAGNGICAPVQPLKVHEDVCVFSEGTPPYFPQMMRGKARWKGGIVDRHGTFGNARSPIVWSTVYHPVSILEFSGAAMRSEREHPTQKPVALMGYLIRTYTNEGDTVLDNTMGSGTTGVACVQTGRDFIGIELREDYFAIAEKRIAQAQQQLRLAI